jgi:hypothetical protein
LTKVHELLQNIEEKVKGLPIPHDVREKFALSAQGGQQNLFASITGAFTPCFPSVNAQYVVNLSTAVYLGASAVYVLDPVLDQQASTDQSIQCIRESHFLFNESTRILSEIFEPDNAFWKKYYQRIDDHFAEPVLSKNIGAELGAETYKALLAKKYSLLFVPLDGLYYLDQKENSQHYTAVEELLKTFILGFNIPNEIRGISDDIRCTINNYALWRLKKLLPEFELNADDFDADELHKLVYATGLAAQLYDEALQYLAEAKRMAEELDMLLLAKLINHRMKAASVEKVQLEEELNLLEK